MTQEHYFNVCNNMIIDYDIDYNDLVKQYPTTQEMIDKWQEDQRKVIFMDNEIIDNPNYEEEKRQEYEDLWKYQFFNTSLGWVRRKVMIQATGETRDFLYDVKPNLSVGDPIITYEKPDFVENFEPIQHRDRIVTEQFLNECKAQIALDFYGEIPQ